ncbi:MAG: alpha/beta fold hydrolase [Alphaproteobacteria bacterium]|nr:alpha/beta fold hydrolase [Alphaproteobacteria bacterium]
MTYLAAEAVQFDTGAGGESGAAGSPEIGRFRPGTGGATVVRLRPQPATFEEFEAPFSDDFLAVHGGSIGDSGVRLRRTGPADAPAILVLGGISAGRGAASAPGDPGWWPAIVGPAAPIDTTRFAVWTADYFPTAPKGLVDLSPGDFARQYVKALRRFGVERLHAAVGASFGGMVALAMASAYPSFVARLSVLCAADRPSPMGRALRRAQRRILELGLASGRGDEATAIARELAIATYRTSAEFNVRFEDPYVLDSYLDHHGRKYGAAVDPRRYHSLSAAIDRHLVDAATICAPTQLVAVEEDQLVAIGDVRRFAEALGGPARLDVISSVYGHDGFLKETDRIGPLLGDWLGKDAHQ